MTLSLEKALQAAGRPAVQVGRARWRKDFFFDESFLGFEGHFPGRPVLPAMTQITMARLLYEEAAGPADALNVLSAKFARPIGPREKVTLELCLEAEGRAAAEIRTLETLAASLRFKPLRFGA